MRAMRRVMQAIVMVVVACVGWMAATQIATEETMYPAGTRWQVWADVTDVEESKDGIIDAFDDLARDFDNRIIFMHATDADGRVDLVAFGEDTPVPGSPVAWYGHSLHGSWQTPDTLRTASLNGSYAFYSFSTAQRFLDWVNAHGGQTGQVQHRPQGLSFSQTLAEPGMAYAVGALLLLLMALVWTDACRRSRSGAIRVMCGVLPWRVRLQDALDDLGMVLPAAALAMGACAVFELCLQGTVHMGGFLLMLLEGTIAVLGLFLAVCMLSSFVLRPRVRNLACRRIPYGFIRGGNAMLCSATVLMCVLGMTLCAGAGVQYRKSSDDLDVWHSLGSLASAQMSAAVTDQYVQEHATDIRRAMEQLDAQRDLALSMSVASFFVPSDGTAPSKEQVRQAIAPYDDVILCNRTFLRIFQVAPDDLDRVAEKTIAPLLEDNLKAYDGLWLVDGAAPLQDNLYRWRSTRIFPSLTYGQDTGTLGNATSPLVIVVDDAAQNLNLEGMLLPALSTGNLVFGTTQALRAALDMHGVGDLAASTSTIADTVYVRITRLRATMVAGMTAMAVIVLALALIGWFAARSWAEEHERLIFVRHVSGVRFAAIIRSHAILAALLVCVTGAIGLCTASYAGQGTLPSGTAQAVALFLLMAVAIETTMAYRAARTRFRGTVLRG